MGKGQTTFLPNDRLTDRQSNGQTEQTDRQTDIQMV